MDHLLAAAHEALGDAYAPYSGYRVGAALGAGDAVYAGCNVENANYSNSLHAEEVALGRAVADGYREFSALAVVSEAGDGVTPCGMCRQSLAEFCDESFPVHCAADAAAGTAPNGDRSGGGASNGESDRADRPDGAPAGPDWTVRTYRLGELLPEPIGADHLGVEP